MTPNSRSRRKIAGLAAASIVVVVLSALTLSHATDTNTKVAAHDSTPRSTASERSPSITHLETDHATFASVNDLAGQSAVVVIGTVVSSSPGESTPLGNDPSTGQPVPALPHTDFVVRVVQSLKGSLATGTQITVTLAGGITDVGPVTVAGVPDLPVGKTFAFFLAPSTASKYYPLAGGAAVAASLPGGQFELSSDVTGGPTIAFSPSVKFGEPDTVRLVVNNAVNLYGAVESGGLSMAPNASGISGAALIKGSAVVIDVTIGQRTASGSFTVDGKEFKIVTGHSAGSTATRASVVGTVATDPQHTTGFYLDVSNL